MKTFEELTTLEHIKIAEEKENMFMHLHAEDGYYLTTFKDGDDVSTFSATVCIYQPIKDMYDDYSVIDAEQYETYVKQLDEYKEQEENAKHISDGGSPITSNSNAQIICAEPAKPIADIDI